MTGASTDSKAGFDLPTRSKSDKARAMRLSRALEARYPDAACALVYRTPAELLVATILSAQTTDVAVNLATPALFEALPSPADYLDTTPGELEPFVRTLGFFRNKAKAIHASMVTVAREHGGEVPRTMEALVQLRGVARKTANVVLGNAWGINEGVVVDTHVTRLARRFGLSDESDPVRIERDLMALFPRPHWTKLSHLLIAHGRAVCRARGARCEEDLICRRYCSNGGAPPPKSSHPSSAGASRSGPAA